ncbi:MAG: amidohydrolase family protein [Planctomycetaceae bacterium]
MRTLLLIVVMSGSLLSQDKPLFVSGGQRFRTEQGDFVRNDGILIEDGRFKSITSASDAPNATKLELADDQFILPGFIDLHAHYNVKLLRKRREEFRVMPTVYLANGVTVTFSAGEYDPDGMLQLRKRIESGEQAGPRLLNSGPYFGRVRRGWRNITDEQIRQDVDTWAERGVGGFKAKGIGPDHLKVLIEQAHKRGLTVTGHLDSGYRGSVNPRDAIEMGIDRIEHFLGGDAMPATRSAYASLAKITTDMPEFKKQVQLFIDRGTYFDCTITAYGYFGKRGEEYDYWMDEREFFTPYIQEIVKKRKPQIMMQFDAIYRAKLKTIAAFHKAGGKISVGTDHFSNGLFLPGFGYHRELDALVRGGIPNADVLRIATLNGAKAMKIDDDHGSIEAGKVADLCIVSGDPLQNIRNTRNVNTVVRAGKVFDAKKLLQGVKGQLGPKDESESAAW